MASVQQFCLRWNNHQPNFISVFTSLLNNETLVDVTLAAEGKQLKAHKVVLSACSTYFQALFTANPCQHPIVILKDIKYNDLKTMVDFMYQGEVNVSQDQLPAILKTAETLKVKGLAEMPEQLSLSKSMSQSSAATEKADSPVSPSVVMRRKRLRKSSTGSEQTSEETAASGSLGSDLVSPSPVKHEPDETHQQPRRETSTESEPRDHSFDDDISTPRNLSEDAGDSNIRWSSTEDIKPSTSQLTQATQGWYMEGYYPSMQATNGYQYGGDGGSNFSGEGGYLGGGGGGGGTQVRRKRSTNPQQDENFIAALEAVRTGGLGFCKAAKLYGVNNRTLWLEYRKRGYPVLRQSTKMMALMSKKHQKKVGGGSICKSERGGNTGSTVDGNLNHSLDRNKCLQKIKLPPLPCSISSAQSEQVMTTTIQPTASLQHPPLPQSLPPQHQQLDYTTPLFSYSTL